VRNVELLTQMRSPYDLLRQESEAGGHVYGYYQAYDNKYQRLLQKALSTPSEDGFLIFMYAAKDSFTSELSNEMLYHRPHDVILIGREKEDEVRLSLRGSGKNIILPRLQQALHGIDGYGGGHEYACGAGIKKKDFAKFVEAFKTAFR
jgi:nanoRNase/pAp phosphatase (c-di-AMP/oligoRNAs hydrolase)